MPDGTRLPHVIQVKRSHIEGAALNPTGIPLPTSGLLATAGPNQPPIVLSIAGFDPSGGAGILADLKTFAAIGVYGMACITALTVQSTQGVCRIEPCDPNILHETLDCLAADARFSAIKVGMLGCGAAASGIADWLDGQRAVPVVVDPVVKSTSGKDLLDAAAFDLVRTRFLARATWITPNLKELAALVSASLADSRAATEESAQKLLHLAAERGNPGLKIVVTGGHTHPPDDLLLTERACEWYPGTYIETNSTHGTGCTFSSALAARIALGDDDFAAVAAAKEYVAQALRNAYPIGHGKGPLNHFWKGLKD